MYRLFGCDTLAVNTFHHQAVSNVPAGFKITATAPDGVIEGMEAVDGRFVIAVQWHPEAYWEEEGVHLALFRKLVDASR